MSKTPEESKLGHGNQRLEIKLAQAFLLITSNFDDDSIKNEQAWKHHFSIKMKCYHQHTIA